ncbi:hypothetical protein DQ354_19555 [Arthrobacter sp. AQ5-06]|nr:hypothetical protein DQ354_19555 [Arthrobacter sp. AQ5-06]
MWLDDQGVCHTVALPDPTRLMSDAFRQSLDQLLARGQEDLAEAIEDEQTRFFEEGAQLLAGDSDEAEFVAVAPPVALMAEPVGTIADLRQLIREIDGRWRLDALAALDDYVP